MAKINGTCKWFNSKKGFGFITPNDGSEDIFVHQSGIHAEGFRSLKQGEAVEYNVTQDDQGRCKAVDVTGPDGAFVEGAPKPVRRRRRRFVEKDEDTNEGEENNNSATNNGDADVVIENVASNTTEETANLETVAEN